MIKIFKIKIIYDPFIINFNFNIYNYLFNFFFFFFCKINICEYNRKNIN